MEQRLTAQLRTKNQRRRAALATSHAATSAVRPRNDLLPKLQLVDRNIDDLSAPARNVRTADPAHVREIANAIATLGFNVPVLIDQDGRVLDVSHQRHYRWLFHKENSELDCCVSPPHSARVRPPSGECLGNGRYPPGRAIILLMTLANMPENGVGSVVATCAKGRHEAVLEVQRWPADTPMPRLRLEAPMRSPRLGSRTTPPAPRDASAARNASQAVTKRRPC